MRVLIAKPGLDGHDRGARIVARALREAGVEVITTGLRWSPDEIAEAALQEDVAIVGLSILAGGHVGLTQDVISSLRTRGLDCDVIVGGTVPKRDVEPLRAAGVAAVFPVGARLADIVAWVQRRAVETEADA